jgi:K+ transporter
VLPVFLDPRQRALYWVDPRGLASAGKPNHGRPAGHRGIGQAAALMVPFQAINLTFFAANLLKIPEGAWLPLVSAGLIMTVMYTWRRGTRLLFEKTRRQEISLADLVGMLEAQAAVHRVQHGGIPDQ